ncbi:hypothetical protein L596_025655 [Steinernema carpocapsae]|uniref:DUF1308 domain-containing protein n=1 Tax=Steinernema carpocapsae TaxID=34508 RepID=A0A4U5M8G3_STECR|nr:hypothetical protein L596_025655 [Steinernema carpocapsae]
MIRILLCSYVNHACSFSKPESNQRAKRRSKTQSDAPEELRPKTEFRHRRWRQTGTNRHEAAPQTQEAAIEFEVIWVPPRTAFNSTFLYDLRLQLQIQLLQKRPHEMNNFGALSSWFGGGNEEMSSSRDPFSGLDFYGKILPAKPLIVREAVEVKNMAPMSPDDLTQYVQKARAEAENVAELVEKGPFYQKPGAEKLRTKIRSEFRILNSIHHYEAQRMAKYVRTSNIFYYSGIRHSALFYATRLHGFFQTFHNHADDRSEIVKIEVDLVLDSGATWVKVIARSPKGLAQECVTGGTGRGRSLLEQAKLWCDIATHYPHYYRPPRIIFRFIHGCPDFMHVSLRNMKIKVEAPRIFKMTEYLIPPPEFDMPELKILEVPSTSETKPDFFLPTVPRLPDVEFDVVNLDITAVFVLISAVTNGGAYHHYNSPFLNAQASDERKKSAKRYVQQQINGKRLIMCTTACDALHGIMKTVAGPREFARVRTLLQSVKIVKDEPSERVKALKNSERINDKSKVIFGTGDQYKAVTVTSNMHFVRAAQSQNVRLQVILHEPRALGEQKQAWKIPSQELEPPTEKDEAVNQEEVAVKNEAVAPMEVDDQKEADIPKETGIMEKAATQKETVAPMEVSVQKESDVPIETVSVEEAAAQEETDPGMEVDALKEAGDQDKAGDQNEASGRNVAME